jgi:mono/diheme cytochrome c family protein
MKLLRAFVSPWLVLFVFSSLASAQLRPTPQVQRRPAPTPQRVPPPKSTSASPDDSKDKDQPKDAPPKPAEQPKAAAASADGGGALFRKNGCYECHSNDAQGGPQGPRLGPNPIPLPRFLAYVRNPSGDMPPFTAKVISDDELRSIYAFLQARPVPPPVANIPLLAP